MRSRGARVTGITLSRHQKAYVDELIAREGFEGSQVLCQDFFTYCRRPQPSRWAQTS